MTQIQLRSWNQMVDSIRKFEEGKLPYHLLVDALEAAMEEADLKDSAIVRAWYDFWTPLEELDEDTSHELEDVSPAQAWPLLRKMKDFLLEQLKLEGRSTAAIPHRTQTRHAHQ